MWIYSLWTLIYFLHLEAPQDEPCLYWGSHTAAFPASLSYRASKEDFQPLKLPPPSLTKEIYRAHPSTLNTNRYLEPPDSQ